LPRALRHDPDEVAVADDRDDAFECVGRAVVERRDVGPVAGCTHDASAQHPGHAQITHERRRTGDQVAPVIRCRSLGMLARECALFRYLAGQRRPGRELGIRRGASVLRANLTGLDREGLARHVPPLRRSPEDELAQVTRGSCKHDAVVAHGQRSERAHIPGRGRGIAELDPHVLDRNLQLVGDQTRERDADPLAELDLPRHGDDRAIGIDAQACFEAGHRASLAARWTARTTRP
jgi:hypothetical protein